jgi:hypothetical protein
MKRNPQMETRYVVHVGHMATAHQFVNESTFEISEHGMKTLPKLTSELLYLPQGQNGGKQLVRVLQRNTRKVKLLLFSQHID